jgi:hypothetical protein
MRTVQDLIIGSAVFMLVDRFARLVSNHAVEQGTMEKTQLRIEIIVLVLLTLITWRIF